MRYPQAVLVSCEIPWDDRERFDEALFRAEVRSALAKGFRHVYVFGAAGEGYAVDGPRFRDTVTVFRDETRGPLCEVSGEESGPTPRTPAATHR